ncbi:MAG: TldD/PmbA family protein [Oscillospiraceae bacterium]|nr:TldD/PmbA family protein [Oscillospiraceae bacterium]MCL2278395.1 TldD/PmbA family protein [Oscillospiraceae bacterium]
MSKSRQELALYALEALKKAGADKAACKVTRSRKEEFNIEANNFSLLRTLFNDELYLKALIGGKKGVVSVNKLDKDSIDKAVDDCVTLAKSATPDEAEDIAEKAENKSFSRNIGGPDMASLFTRTKEFLEQSKDEFPKIIFESMASEFTASETTYVNSNGVEFNDECECYSYGPMFSAKDGEKSSSFNYTGSTLTRLDKPFMDIGLMRALLDESVRSLDTRMVDEKFVGKVIVAPTCGDMIWDTLLYSFLGDGSLIEGTSRWKDSLGEKVADSKLTMRLAPLNEGIVGGERFTPDGFEAQNTDLIRDGVLNSFALSLYGSKKVSKPRALCSSGALEIVAGDASLADMIKSVEKGILLGRFSGASPGASGDVSGVAKNSFLIENGAVTDAISETMVSFNVVDILQNILSISKERNEDGSSLLPWCLFDGITVSGK